MSDARKELPFGRGDSDLEQILRHTDPNTDSTDRLTDELIDLLDNASETEFDGERFDSLLGALDKDDPLPDPDAFDAKKGLERFYERRSDAFAADRESAATSSISSSRPKHRRLPRLFLIAAVLVLLVAGSAQAFHFNVFDLFARWTSEIFHLDNRPAAVAQVTRNPLADREERTYDSIEDMLSEFGITAPLLPTWVPERFTSPEIGASYADTGLRLYITYYANNESLLKIKANQVNTSNLKDIEKNYSDVVYKQINGTLYYFMSDVEGREKVIWQNGEFECIIIGTVTRDEMEQIISSIEKG